MTIEQMAWFGLVLSTEPVGIGRKGDIDSIFHIYHRLLTYFKIRSFHEAWASFAHQSSITEHQTLFIVKVLIKDIAGKGKDKTFGHKWKTYRVLLALF